MALRALLWRPTLTATATASRRRMLATGVRGPEEDDESATSPGPVYDNKNVVLSLIDKGRLMKLRFQDQKEFQMFLERANAIGVTQPDDPECITGRLSELDPKRIHVLIDHKTVLKYSKKIAMEKAEKGNCPTDFIKFMDKDYQTDDD